MRPPGPSRYTAWYTAQLLHQRRILEDRERRLSEPSPQAQEPPVPGGQEQPHGDEGDHDGQ